LYVEPPVSSGFAATPRRATGAGHPRGC
jgi:hypothetical protein